MNKRDKLTEATINILTEYDKHMVNIPVGKNKDSNSPVYYNDDRGITFEVPDNLDYWVKTPELLEFYNKCVESAKFNEDQLEAIKDILMNKEWKKLNIDLDTIEKICDPKYSADYMKSFRNILVSNKKVTPDIFFDNTDPYSKYEIDSDIGLNKALSYLATIPHTKDHEQALTDLYINVKDNYDTFENRSILSKLQRKLSRPGNQDASNIIEFYKNEIY